MNLVTSPFKWICGTLFSSDKADFKIIKRIEQEVPEVGFIDIKTKDYYQCKESDLEEKADKELIFNIRLAKPDDITIEWDNEKIISQIKNIY